MGPTRRTSSGPRIQAVAEAAASAERHRLAPTVAIPTPATDPTSGRDGAGATQQPLLERPDLGETGAGAPRLPPPRAHGAVPARPADVSDDPARAEQRMGGFERAAPDGRIGAKGGHERTRSPAGS